MVPHTAFASVLAVLLSFTAAAPLNGFDRQPIENEYDFIICGGGTAGLVLANRLTESGVNRVLVLEAGQNPDIVAAYKTPGGNQLLAGSAIDFSFYTTDQKHLDNRNFRYLRGKCLGGSSAINGLYYGRGTSTVYNKWRDAGNPGWGWEDVYPLFVKGTTFNPPTDHVAKGFDVSYKTWDPTAYSDGPLQLGFQGYVPPSGVGFIEASAEALKIPIVKDYNKGNSTGVKQGVGCIDGDFQRSSSYDGYLKKAIDRPNLDVLHLASVWKINFDTTGGKPRAKGVAFIDNPSGLVYEISAKKEVILSMGAFNSPQLLMVSGVGPTDQLDKFGITPVHINENIGQHLNDHSVFSIMALSTPEFSTSDMVATYADLRAAQDQFYSTRTGEYTAPSGITNAFQRFSVEELRAIGAEAVIEAGLEDQSHIEYLYESVFYPSGPTPFYTPEPDQSYISLTASSMVALSRGNVSLRSRSMADYPIINPNYYADPTDEKVAIACFKYLRKILAHPRMSQYTVGPNHGEVSPGPAVADDDEEAILAYIRQNTIPNWHASGTVQMLPEANGGVVDPELKVYGIDGLRVVDCSIIPVLPDVNIMGPVYMIAEKGAEMIRKTWGDL